MSVANLWKIRTLYVVPEVTFSTDPSTDGSGYSFVPARDLALPSALQAFIERPLQRDALTQTTGILGAKGGKFGFKLELLPLTTNGGAAVSQRAYVSAVLKACGFAETLGTGSTISGAGATPTSLPVVATDGFAVGTLVGWVNAGGAMELAQVTARSASSGGGTLTVSPALSGSPSAADAIFASATYTQADSDPGTAAFHLLGDGYRFTLTGCRGKVKLEGFTAAGVPVLAFEFEADSFDTSTKASLPAATMPTGAPALAKGGRVLYDGSAVPIQEFAFDPGFAMTARPSISGGQGRAGWALTDRKSAGSFKPSAFASAYATNFQAGTEKQILAQLGSIAKGCFGVLATAAQIVDYPVPADIGGTVGHDIKFQVNASGVATLPDFAIAWL